METEPILSASYVADDWGERDRATAELEIDGVVWAYARADPPAVGLYFDDPSDEGEWSTDCASLIGFLRRVAESTSEGSKAEMTVDPRGVVLAMVGNVQEPGSGRLCHDGRAFAGLVAKDGAWLEIVHYLELPIVRIEAVIRHLEEVCEEISGWQRYLDSH
jgi:hypothetical protein